MQLQKTNDNLKSHEDSWGYLYHQNKIIAGRLKNVDWRTNQILMNPVEKIVYPSNPHRGLIRRQLSYNNKSIFSIDNTTEFHSDSKRNIVNYIRLCNLKYEMEFFDMFHRKKDLEEKIMNKDTKEKIVIVPRNFSIDNLK